MKHLLLTTIAAVVLVGCGSSMSIHNAAWKGNIEDVKKAITAGADVNANVDGTPLFYAVLDDHKEIVELLIAKGANVNAKDKTSWTPLHFLTTKAVAELLITKGCALHCLWPSHFVLSIYLVHSYALPSFHSHE